MKKLFIILLCFPLIYNSCTQPRSKQNITIQELEKRIDDLERERNSRVYENIEVTDYFTTLNLLIEEYFNMAELILNTTENSEKNNQELSLFDQINLVKSISVSAINILPLVEKIEALESKAEILKKDMTPQELEVFMDTYTNLMVHFYEVSQKLENQ